MRKVFLVIATICFPFLCQASALLVGDLMTIAKDVRFQSRVSYYLHLAAINVMAEAANTASHTSRVTYAKTVLNGVADPYRVSIEVLTNATIAAEATTQGPDFGIPDSDIQFTVNSIFNALAGIST